MPSNSKALRELSDEVRRTLRVLHLSGEIDLLDDGQYEDVECALEEAAVLAYRDVEVYADE